GNALRRITRIGERWLCRGIEIVFMQQLAKSKVLVAAGGGVQRVWRSAVKEIRASVVVERAQAFVDGPAEILSRARDNLQRLPSSPPHVSDVENARPAISRIVTARVRFQHHAIGISQTERPHRRARRARIGRIIEVIAGYAVAGRRIAAKNISVEAVGGL